MTKHDDTFHLEAIREHIIAIKGYLPQTKEEYLADDKTQDAVLMRLLALGEETARLSEGFQTKHSDLDWFKIVGLRNRIAHGYFEIDPEIIWDTVTDKSFDGLLKVVE
jgi:uncharacterized protein with HEPN domain